MTETKELKFQKWILFTCYNESSSLAMHLQKEGKDVMVGVVDDLKSAGMKKPEDKESKKRRQLNFKGILDIYKAEDLLKKMEKFPNKEDYFVICDFNSLYEYADKIIKMGFIHGLFPTKFDYKLENDRKMAKEFVESYYPELKVAECLEYKDIDEGIEMIEGSEEFWALKGNDISCQTVVPYTHNINFAREEIIDALRSHKEDYERQGYILERQIRDGVEFCPQMVCYNGIPVAYSVDIENKAIGSGNCSIKAGCAHDLVVAMDSDATIIPKAFPEAVLKLAKKHKGLFYVDANLILKDGELYFLEFCFQRMGYDAIQTECEMAGGVSNYFEAIANGCNPYEKKYGVAIRGFNMHKDDDGESKGGMQMRWLPEYEDHTWLYDAYKDDKGKYLNCGYEWELLSVFTGSSDDVEYAIIKAYEAVNEFSFNEMYTRSEGDFNDRNYHGNVLDRLEAIEDLISPESDGEDNEE